MASLNNKGLLDLPNELLYTILDLCRPNNFESSVLTCKGLYTTTKALILVAPIYGPRSMHVGRAKSY